MRKLFVVLAFLVGLAGLWGLGFRHGTVVRQVEAAAHAAAPHARPSDVPVVVELFTSEGCSSCPAADDVLARLEQTAPVPGATVVPLAFHVDYWDDLGWPDRFASPSFTSRQQTYAARGRMYTPQAVVDGRTELVGSNATGLERAIAQSALRAHVPVEVAVRSKGDVIEVNAHVEPLPARTTDGLATGALLFVALTQAQATVAVARGENAGRMLHHTAIVRELESAGGVAASGADAHVTFRAPSGVPQSELRIVAFVQRASDHEIVGSATHGLPVSEQLPQAP